MGVYHFMGLGRSPGAVSAAISYLADRYERYNDSDKQFFSGSGEAAQTAKRGDIQGLVLFTTHEVKEGERHGLALDYLENVPRRVRQRHVAGERMSQILERVLPPLLRRLDGGRGNVEVYWCEIDLADPYLTFERAARALHAAKPPGEVGKEVWINLTGGGNVINLALQLAAGLLGHPARVYYTYMPSEDISCLYHTTPPANLGTGRDRFWVEIPLIYLGLDAAALAVLQTLETLDQPVSDQELLSFLKNDPAHGPDFQSLSLQDFQRNYLLPMRGNQIVLTGRNMVAIGPGWSILKRYYEIVADLQRPGSGAETSLGALAGNNPSWCRQATI